MGSRGTTSLQLGLARRDAPALYNALHRTDAASGGESRFAYLGLVWSPSYDYFTVVVTRLDGLFELDVLRTLYAAEIASAQRAWQHVREDAKQRYNLDLPEGRLYLAAGER